MTLNPPQTERETIQRERTQEWNGCEGRGRSLRSVERPRRFRQGWQWGRHEGYVTSVQVCARGGRGQRQDIVKGLTATFEANPVFGAIRVGAKRVPEWARPVGIAAPRFERTNCGTWQPPSECPRSHAAQQIILHHKALGGRRALTGVQLVCRRMRRVMF
ncbi:MAG: hypothetical protein AAF791_04410 [Bacteroidota bacterium]